MKLSVYGFNDLTRSYGVIELDEEEYRELLKNFNEHWDKLKEILEEAFGEFRSFKLAKGTMFYEKTRYPMTYISMELVNNDLYVFEIYPNSIGAMSNTGVRNLVKVISKFLEKMVGEKIKRPWSRGMNSV